MFIFLPGKQMTLYTSCGLCLISRVAEPVCFFTGSRFALPAPAPASIKTQAFSYFKNTAPSSLRIWFFYFSPKLGPELDLQNGSGQNIPAPAGSATLLMSQAKERVCCRAPGPGYEWVEVSVARGSERQYSLAVSG